MAHGGDASAFGGATSQREVSIDPHVQKEIGLRTVRARDLLVRQTFAVSGEITSLPQNTYAVTAPLAGRLVSLNVAAGDHVSSGQALGVIDSPDLRGLSADAGRTSAQARADIADADARVQLAQTTYVRENDLFRQGIAARKDLDQARADLAQAQASRRAAQARLRLAGSDVAARLAALGQSSAGSGRVVLSAPGSGVVVAQAAASGEAVEAGKPIITIVDQREVYGTAQVFEKDVARVHVGQPVTLTASSFPNRTFSGRVAVMGSAVDAQTRTLPVQILIKNPENVLKPRMFATFRFTGGTDSVHAITIPTSAVLRSVDGSPSQVFVQDDDGGFVLTNIVIGAPIGDQTVVLQGLKPGDTVVSERAFQVQAQLLKGSGVSDSATSDEKKPNDSELKKSSTQFPPWLWLIGGLVAILVAFAGGRRSNRSQRSR